MSRGLLNEDETRELLAPYEERLQAVIVRAVARWQSAPPGVTGPLGAGSRATVVHDYLKDAARDEFLSCERVTVNDDAGTIFLVFHGCLAVRFKKVDGDHFRYSLGGTRRQQAIHNQQLTLSDTEAHLTWATAGYQLDEADQLTRAVLVVQEGENVRFAFDIGDMPSAAPDSLPLTYDQDEDEDSLVIRPAGSVSEGEQTDGGTGT